MKAWFAVFLEKDFTLASECGKSDVKKIWQ